MRPSVDYVLSTYNRMRSIFSVRADEYRILRAAFDAQFVSNQSTAAILADEFSDKKKLVYNMINTAIRRYMDEMSAPAEPWAIPRGIEQKDLELAELRQKLLVEIFEENQIDVLKIKAAYYQGLLDKAVFLVRPDPRKKYRIAIELVVPEFYYPIPESSAWDNRRGVILGFHPFKLGDNELYHDPDGRNFQSVIPSDLAVEYWDEQHVVRVQDGRETFHDAHGWGFVPVEEAHNIPIPHRQRGQGDADQVLGLNEYLNELLSDQADVLAYLAHPIVVVRGSKIGNANLQFGPRATWEIERDASAEILTWAGSPPSFEAQILRVMQGIEDATGLSSPAFGREIPSGVSGEAVRSILAGFNTRVGAKQTLMGSALNRLCVKIQAILEREYPNQEFEVPGEGGDPDRGAVIRPREFGGFYKTKIIFQPQNETVRVFTELEKLRSGVQSKLTTMRRLGIANPAEEYRRMREEQMHDERIKMLSLGGGAQGLPPAPGSQPPGLPMPEPARQPVRDPGVEALAKGIKASDPGTLRDLLGSDSGVGRVGARGKVDVRDVLDRLESLDVSGKTWLEGQIVDEGSTEGTFTLRVENDADRAQITEALGPLADRARFISGTDPQEGPRVRATRPRR